MKDSKKKAAKGKVGEIPPEPQQEATINDHIERAQYLAACIFPGDGFVVSESIDTSAMLLELLSLVSLYDDRDDRDYLIFGIGQSLYPTTFEGQKAVQGYVERASQVKLFRKKHQG